jgi:hypothetical protein
MRTLVGILVLVATSLTFSAAPVAAGSYGVLAWCNVQTTNIPGGTANHRLAITNSWTDPMTGLVGFGIYGAELETGANAWGYGATAPGGGEPINLSWTSGNTANSPQVRTWNVRIQGGLLSTRITDINTNGTFTNTNGVTTIACQF